MGSGLELTYNQPHIDLAYISYDLVKKASTTFPIPTLHFPGFGIMPQHEPTPFLSLPPELRVRIYDLLLVRPIPIKGPHARRLASEKLSIDTAILRTNRQINLEARHVFFGRNTFSVNALPPAPLLDEDADPDLGSGAIEPPLQLADLHLIRHLELDMLHCPPTRPSQEKMHKAPWTPTSRPAQLYIASLSHLLAAAKPNLRSLTLVADTRPHSPDLRSFLTGFYYADQNARFKGAIGTEKVGLRFEFADMEVRFEVEGRRVREASLTYFAGQVVVKKGEIVEWEEQGGKGRGEVVVDWVC
jgi:hypothetical protein